MYLAINSANQATTSDIKIAPGDNFTLTSVPSSSPVVPGGDVAAIADNGGSTTFVVCDY
jgi:hypothetical protein